MLPTKKMLKMAWAAAQRLAQQPKEIKGEIHYGIFLLCFGAGLRVSEAISFDYQKQINGLFIVPSKNKQFRKVAVNEEIVQELKSNNWQPLRSNRFNFSTYCKRVKKETGLPNEVELTPHTGRRAWATYQAEQGVPLPILSQMLGHKNLETTAQYYWKETSSNEQKNILTGQSLTARTNILNSVKDKKYWQEYNAKRKEYHRQYYSESKKEKGTRKFTQWNKVKDKTPLTIEKKQPQNELFTTDFTTYSQQLTNPPNSITPPSRLERLR